MKRCLELKPLSREHQSALSLAIRAKRAAASANENEVNDLACVVTQVFERELEPHFQFEEIHLLPRLLKVGEAELVERTLQEHKSMRALKAQLAAHADAATLAEFGVQLENHVRFEERELFEVIQNRLDLSQLNVNQ